MSEPETSIGLGDQVQSIEDNWQGRVTGFQKIDDCTFLVCHHVSGGEIELDDKRLFDPRDVRLLRKMYTVIGFYADTGLRFLTYVTAESVEDVLLKLLETYEYESSLTITAVIVGEHKDVLGGEYVEDMDDLREEDDDDAEL